MFLKHFREVRYRVKDPQRPGHTTFDERLDSAGTWKLELNGETYLADDDGWFDLPEEVGEHFARLPGWRTPEMVDEEVVAGRIRADESDETPGARKRRKTAPA